MHKSLHVITAQRPKNPFRQQPQYLQAIMSPQRGGLISPSSSTRATSSAHANPTQAGTPCHWPQYEVFAPLKNSDYAQDWWHYYWPQPAATTTCTVDKKNPSPTTIQPPKAQKPGGVCPNQSPLCRLFEGLRAYEAAGNADFASKIWFVVTFWLDRSLARRGTLAYFADSSCIETTRMVVLAALLKDNDG